MQVSTTLFEAPMCQDWKTFQKIILQIGTTCQSYNIGKVYVTSILPWTRASIDLGQIKEVIKKLCHKNNFVFINHQNITSNDL